MNIISTTRQKLTGVRTVESVVKTFTAAVNDLQAIADHHNAASNTARDEAARQHAAASEHATTAAHALRVQAKIAAIVS
jgi:hypothetical protein